MKGKRKKSITTVFDFAEEEELSIEGMLLNVVPFVHLPADESFCYLGMRASVLARNATQPRTTRRRCSGWRPLVT
jgi:hypothetical protein